ncbi:hypothetical protein SEEC0006_08662 [Salmonella enterica subsp. enterica serovar Choleraesuis str. 0006]|nr:hypothetical protein SEEC0006_08662 [Salmonella enterica subsp. enterica serovar Choleraesuis str. 0006]
MLESANRLRDSGKEREAEALYVSSRPLRALRNVGGLGAAAWR